MHNKRLIKTLFIILFISLVAYALYTARHIITGPVVTLSGISAEEVNTVHEQILTLSGSVTNTALLKLNGHVLTLNFTDKSFAETVLLSEGINIFNLDAFDKFGRASQKRLTVLYHSE